MRSVLPAVLLSLGLNVCARGAERPLDIYLNTVQLDAFAPGWFDEKAKDYLRVSREQPLGQTFITGERVEKLYRVAIWDAFWSESWQPDEVLVMTLWDSPAKKAACGRFAISYFQRMWEKAVPMFTLDARVQPHQAYYFELTVELAPPKPAEVPRECLLTRHRPGFAQGDGVIEGLGRARQDYPGGCAYVGGVKQDFDMWFETHARYKVGRDALYAQAFDRFDLTYPPLAKLKELIEARKWDEAVTELVRYFESRTDLVMPEKRTPQFDPGYDTREADLASIQQVWVPQDDTTVDLAPYWNYFALWGQRGGVGLTRGGMRKPLGEAYQKTGNEKYARAFNEMLADYYVSLPSPALAGAFKPDEPIPSSLAPGIAGGSMWSALSVGARILHGFHYYSIFADSPFFTQDVRAKWIINMGELAEVLERQKGGGNWETQMADALFQFGVTYPEFKKARQRAQRGLDTLIANALATVRPDGVLREPTVNYHGLVLNRYSKVIQQVRSSGIAGLTVPEEMVKLTEKMFQYLMYATLPDGTLPIWGDSNHPTRPDLLERGAEMYQRDDFLYVFSGGAKGKAPAATSYAFPDGGFYYMRNSWGQDANYLGIHAGPFGSHGHRDALSFVMAARGRTVLIDPGVHTYGTPESTELNATRSHNTITVDDRDSRSAVTDAWATAPGFDFLAGQNEGYEGLKDVRHHRRIWFLKAMKDAPDAFVVFDDLVGHGEHTAALRYRFAPLKVTHDADCGCVWTQEPSGNLYVQVHAEPRAALQLGQGIAVWGDANKRNEKGELALGTLQQVPVATYTVRGSLPLGMVSVLTPFSGPEVHAWKESLLTCTPGVPGVRAVWLERGDQAILAACNALSALAAGPQPMQINLPDGSKLDADAAGVAIRFKKSGSGWTAFSLHAVRAAAVRLGDRPLHGAQREDTVDAMLP